jgi:hypothetical protein
MKIKAKTIDDTVALRAFVMPDLFPFLLEVYTKDGKDEAALIADIKQARETYKNLVSASKKPVAKTASYKPVAFEENQANP